MRDRPFELTRRSVLAGFGAACLPPPTALARPTGFSPRRGVNISDWFGKSDGITPAPSDAVLTDLARWGFDTVRLPIAPDHFTGDANGTSGALRAVEKAVDALAGHGLSVILDMHPQRDLAGRIAISGAARQQVGTAWLHLRRLVSETSPESVAVELLNEPQMDRVMWQDLRQQLAEIVRWACPDHTLIWGAAKFQSVNDTVNMPTLDMPNTMAAIHYYTPMEFTHQGRNWRDPLPCLAADETWSAATITEHFARIADWSRANDTPVMLNEFGVLKFCDGIDRASWVRTVRQAAETAGLSWYYWELDRGFGFLDNGITADGVDLSVVDALIPGAVA